MECSLNSTQGYQKYMKIKQKEIVRIKAENSNKKEIKLQMNTKHFYQ